MGWALAKSWMVRRAAWVSVIGAAVLVIVGWGAGRGRAAEAGDLAVERELAEAKAALAAIEKRVYAERPELKEAEDAFAEVRSESAKNDRLWDRVGPFLEAERQKRGDGSARDRYLAMVEEWTQLTQLRFVEDPKDYRMFQSTVNQTEPYRQRLIEQMLRSNPQPNKAELADREGFWRAYKAMAERAIPVYRANLARNEKRSGFPQFVLDCAKEVGINNGRSILYAGFCAANTPRELIEARKKVRRLELKLPSPLTRPAGANGE